MSLPAILEQIRARGESQMREIDERANKSAESILAQARLDAERIESAAREEAASPGATERAQILHKARMDSLQTVGGARAEWMDKVLTHTKTVLSDIRSDSRYPSVLCALIREALTELASEDKTGVQIAADPRDKLLLEKITVELGVSIVVDYSLTCWGGVTANSTDGRLTVINTLEARFERITPFLRGHLAARFERKPHG